MINYEKRLLKELKEPWNTIFTANDFATIWKRSKQDVGVAVAHLVLDGKIKVLKNGTLRLL